ncbi:hypothetical protein IF1G_11282 [Cordyceps javanica]|uniref:Uncharacterized protein n=1 Tax=Cordyceps javanica TaxID=43265 RepID=A0A545UKR6_9HYPO|nr:hypothetical protein IF1G_11282 [Cordyceps javanica]
MDDNEIAGLRRRRETAIHRGPLEFRLRSVKRSEMFMSPRLAQLVFAAAALCHAVLGLPVVQIQAGQANTATAYQQASAAANPKAVLGTAIHTGRIGIHPVAIFCLLYTALVYRCRLDHYNPFTCFISTLFGKQVTTSTISDCPPTTAYDAGGAEDPGYLRKVDVWHMYPYNVRSTP